MSDRALQDLMKDYYEAALDGSLPGGGGGSTTFTGLTDTPSDYTGHAGKVVTVNGTEDGVEFTTPASGGFVDSITYSANALLTGNKIISPVAGEGDWANDPMGYGTELGGTVVSVQSIVEEFTTNGGGTIEIGFRYVAADGTRTGPFNPGQGTLLGTTTITLPDTLGAGRFYFVERDSTMSWVVPANSVVFCYIVGQSVTAATGLVVNLFVDPN